jgi:hypothetical protein
MKSIIEMLPTGWEEKAKELGAMERESGVIRRAESLLRLNMLYTTNEGSFQAAATGMELSEGIVISKEAAAKRIRKSGEWMRWMAEELCVSQGAVVRKPEFLGERAVKLIDASDETTRGKEKNTWRLHYSFDLFSFSCCGMKLTDNKEGERLTRHSVNENDIIIADRIYCTMSGIEHVLDSKGDFVIRFKSKAFKLYDEAGNSLELLTHLRGLKALENTEADCFYKHNGKLRPIRIVAMKKDWKAVESCKRRMANKYRGKKKPLQDDTIELNEYIILATSLEYTTEQILELYRARWQVEQVFFRLKSLFGYGDVPSKRDDSVKAWFYGKLLLAALCESILKRVSFPPELDFAIVGIVGAQFMG